MNRQEAIALAQKIRALRKNKLKTSDLIRLIEMPHAKREYTIERLVEAGYADSAEEIHKMIRRKDVMDDPHAGMRFGCEAKGMSDDILDRGIQYIHVPISEE